MTFRIRSAVPRDVTELADLCEEHAAFERSPVPAQLDMSRLKAALFNNPPRLWALVVEGGPNCRLVGYASYTIDFSTWSTATYLNLDCLFVKSDYRRSGIGRALMERVRTEAGRLGCSTAEWQTPSWNAPAISFYERLGATRLEKCRYRWKVPEAAE